MFNYGLSSQQLAVICALSSGATMTSAAEEAGVHRNTVTNWLRNLLPFQQALAGAQYARALFFREKMEELVDLAAKAIHDILADPNTSASVRLRAALAVLQTASTPPLPKRQLCLDIEKVVIKPNPTVITEDQFAPAAEPSPENSTNLHTAAQSNPDICHAPPSADETPHNSAQPPHHPTPKIGRNEACPCGSGLKYKRCCLNQPQTNAA